MSGLEKTSSYAVTSSFRDQKWLEGFVCTKKRALDSWSNNYCAVALNKQHKTSFLNSSPEPLQTSRTQRPIEIPIVHTWTVQKLLDYTSQPTTVNWIEMESIAAKRWVPSYSWTERSVISGLLQPTAVNTNHLQMRYYDASFPGKHDDLLHN